MAPAYLEETDNSLEAYVEQYLGNFGDKPSGLNYKNY